MLAMVTMAMREATGFTTKERYLTKGEDVVAVLAVDEEEDEEAMVMPNSTIDTTSPLAKVVATEWIHITSTTISITLRMKAP